MQKIRFGLFVALLCGLMVFGSTHAASTSSAQEIADEIITTSSANMHPQEALVQWYYALAGLRDRVLSLESSSDEAIATIEEVTSRLRDYLDDQKTHLVQTGINDFWNAHQNNLEGRDKLSSLCSSIYQLADDRSFALNLPTALTIGVLDMESSCRMSNPNTDGIFQIIANNYVIGPITTGHWISQIYDFNDFIQRNRAWYHDANKLDIDDCQYKDTNLVGQTAPICLSYTTMDLDSVVKMGALYNGLRVKEVIDGKQESRIKGDIQPTNPNYVYGHFDADHMDTNKAGLLVRILQVLEHERTNS